MKPDIDSFVSEIRLLEAIGPRLTGSDAHRYLIERIASQLQALGLDVQRDPYVFMRWDVPPERSHIALRIGGEEIEVSSAFPYSGTTGRDGFTGPLRFIPGFARRWSAARGAIAVVEVQHVSVPFNLLFKRWDKTLQAKPGSHPILSALLCGPWFRRARKAGVRAVICVWRGLAGENAKNQYLPFWQDYHDVPAIWVAGDAAERVIAAARQGKEAHLLLNATLTPNCKVETLWAVSPGSERNETVLFVTHTDGTNVVQENGYIALLELARDAASRPHKRTFVYVFVARHLRIPGLRRKKEVTAAWLESHPDLWAGVKGNACAVAGLVIEHLGARKFRTPGEDREVIYATTSELHQVALKNLSTGNEVSVLAPRPFVYLGEGVSLYEHNIPAITLVTGPQYLVVEGAERQHDERALGLVDPYLMERQIEGFRQLQDHLDTAPAASIGEVKQPGLRERAVQLARIFSLIGMVVLGFARFANTRKT